MYIEPLKKKLEAQNTCKMENKGAGPASISNARNGEGRVGVLYLNLKDGRSGTSGVPVISTCLSFESPPVFSPAFCRWAV